MIQFYCERCGGLFNCSPKARPTWCDDCRKQVEKEYQAEYYRGRKSELARLRAANAELEKKHENRGHLMDAYVTALAEIADGRESPVEYARAVLRQGSNTLIESMKALSRAEQTKPEPCVWSRGEFFRSGCGQSINAISGFKFCPFCGRRIEVKE